MYPKAHLITFQKVGKPIEGYISIAELEQVIPFPVKRTFWTYYTPESVVRGRHAHYQTQQVLIAVAGRITVQTETPAGQIDHFVLEHPHQGVYIPPDCWHTMQYSHNAVQLVFASTAYQEADYIRVYEDFKKLKG
ncbi:MAG: FdtA/QdtA family cupin domain-containing protein [Saprospiraceae bacterium]|nr:FdtA/QdtA family cupin domain-containing protein [Saprospiraceae bacterium]